MASHILWPAPMPFALVRAYSTPTNRGTDQKSPSLLSFPGQMKRQGGNAKRGLSVSKLPSNAKGDFAALADGGTRAGSKSLRNGP